MDNCSPGRCFILRLRSDMDTLHVKFKHGCIQFSGAAQCRQLRRAARAEVVGEEDGASPIIKIDRIKLDKLHSDAECKGSQNLPLYLRTTTNLYG